MRFWFWGGVIYLSCTCGGGLASHLQEREEKQFVDLSQISLEETHQFFEQQNASTVLVCSEGLSLPISFFLRGDLIELDRDSELTHTLLIKRTFYLCWQEEQMWISLDGQTWQDWQKLLTGSLSVLLHPAPDVVLSLGATAYVR